MGLDAGMHSLGLTLQVFFLDLLLSGDNAIVIALACRRLPLQQMRQAVLIGTGAAVGLRILFTTIVSFLLAIPCLKLLGMLALIVIAIKLLIEEDSDIDETQTASGSSPLNLAGSSVMGPISLRSTVGIIVVADVTMSLDNVVALAAISENSVYFLVLGLALSVPLLMYGSLFVATLLKRYPVLIPGGGVLLGWVAGDIGMSDPLIADWVTAQLPGLTFAVPLACACFVLLESRIVQQNLKRFPKPKPVASVAMHESSLNTTVPNSARVQLAPCSNAAATTSPNLPLMMLVQAGSMEPRHDTAPALETSAHVSVPDKRNVSYAPIIAFKYALYLIIPFFVLAVLGVVGSIVYNGVMPPPRQLLRYECPGYTGPFSFYFLHGRDNVQIRSSSGRLDGIVHYGKIDWLNFTGDTSVLGFTPPQEITYDDAKSIRINGGSFLQINCANKDQSAGATQGLER